MIKRLYVFTDLELLSFLNDIIYLIKKNISDFMIYNIDINQINSFKDEVNSFEKIIGDEFFLYSSVIETKNKNTAKSVLVDKLKDLVFRISIKFGTNSPEYKNFRMSKRYAFTDEEIITVSERTLSLLVEMIAELADTGITTEMLEEFEDLIASYKNARDRQIKSQTERNERTKERIILGNQLYNKVMLYCAIGKKIYKVRRDPIYNMFFPPKRNKKKSGKTDDDE